MEDRPTNSHYMSASAKAATHIPSMKSIEVIFKIPKITSKTYLRKLTLLSYNMLCPISYTKGE